MNIKSSIRATQNLDILKQHNIPFIYKNELNGHIEIQCEGSLIHCWLSTGSYRNINTGKSGKGIYNLISYLDWIKNNKGKSASETTQTEPDDDHNLPLIDRVTLLEMSLQSALERISELEKALFKNEG